MWYRFVKYGNGNDTSIGRKPAVGVSYTKGKGTLKHQNTQHMGVHVSPSGEGRNGKVSGTMHHKQCFSWGERMSENQSVSVDASPVWPWSVWPRHISLNRDFVSQLQFPTYPIIVTPGTMPVSKIKPNIISRRDLTTNVTPNYSQPDLPSSSAILCFVLLKREINR